MGEDKDIFWKHQEGYFSLLDSIRKSKLGRLAFNLLFFLAYILVIPMKSRSNKVCFGILLLDFGDFCSPPPATAAPPPPPNLAP